MKFGIFYELQLPRPWNEDSEYRLYQNALDQVGLADQLGYDYAWEVEHHFLEEYSHSPAPEVFLAAASQRTKQIRLGHGIFQLTTNHPAKVAEKISVLDLISDGRVEFGMGESASVTELEPPRRRLRRETGDLRRGRAVPDPDVPARRSLAQGPLLRLPGPQCPAQAASEAAPAAVGRLLAAGDHHLRRPEGPGRAGLPVRQRRRRPRLGARLLQRHHQAARQAGRLSDQSEHRPGLDVHVRGDRRGGPGQGRERGDLLPVLLCASMAPARIAAWAKAAGAPW